MAAKMGEFLIVVTMITSYLSGMLRHAIGFDATSVNRNQYSEPLIRLFVEGFKLLPQQGSGKSGHSEILSFPRTRQIKCRSDQKPVRAMADNFKDGPKLHC